MIEMLFGEEIDFERFVHHFWERSFLFTGQRVEELQLNVSLTSLLQLIRRGDLRYPTVRLFRGGLAIDPTEFTRIWRYGGEEFPLLIDSSRVEEFVGEGATLILQSLEQYYPEMTCVTRQLESVLRCPVQANAFYTPKGVEGVAPHYDAADVIVLQITGRKHWRIWDCFKYLPLGTEPFDQNRVNVYTSERSPERLLELASGQALYLPRGLVHAAESRDQASLHVAFVIHPIRWCTIMRQAVDELFEELVEDPTFRTTFVDRDSCVRAERLSKETISMFAEAFTARFSVERVLASAAGRVRAEAFVDYRGRLLDVISARCLQGGSVIARRHDVPFDFESKEKSFSVLGPGRAVSFPARMRSAIVDLFGGHSVRVRDIKGIISLEKKVEIAVALVRNGFFRVLRT